MKFTAFQIVSIVLSILALAALCSLLVMSRIKAGKIGILQSKLLRNLPLIILCGAGVVAGIAVSTVNGNKANAEMRYADDLTVRGAEAYEDRHNVYITEYNTFETLDLLVEAEYQKTLSQAGSYKAASIGGILISVASGLVFLINGVRVTEEGLMRYIDLKPRSTYAKNENGEIDFYTDKNPLKVWARFPAVIDELDLFDGFIEKEPEEDRPETIENKEIDV